MDLHELSPLLINTEETYNEEERALISSLITAGVDPAAETPIEAAEQSQLDKKRDNMIHNLQEQIAF